MNPTEKLYPKPTARILVRILEELGVKEAVLSPGTRNTPLVLAFDSSPEIKKLVVIDERSAGFVGLGIALSTRRPVALVCTSGSAMLNYAPAVAEAYYRRIPLIVISADRPPQWIDQSDSQTIRQLETLRNIVKKSVEIPDSQPSDSEAPNFAARQIADAVYCALRTPHGPVHINMPFDLPLGLNYQDFPDIRIPRVLNRPTSLSTEQIKELAREIADKKILVVVGGMQPNSRLNKAFERLASIQDVTVLAEGLSNLHGPSVITNVDATLAYTKHSEKAAPELVIVCGGSLVSNRMKEYLRHLEGINQWHVGPYADSLQDTFLQLSLAVETEPDLFFPAFASLLAKYRAKNLDGSFSEIWRIASRDGLLHYRQYNEEAPWSEFKAISFILNNLPAPFNLHLSNGTAVRYALLHDLKSLHGVWCNRGVSGIEGSTSTSIGASLSYSGPTMLISGDMSASYDIQALSLRGIPNDFKLIVISNGGGGIFRIIDKTSNLPQRESYFCAEPKFPIKELADAYGFSFVEADSFKSLESLYPEFISNCNAPSILNIKVDPEISAEIFKRYYKTLNSL